MEELDIILQKNVSCAGERSTPDLKPMRKDTRSPKQEQSVAPQTGPWSNKNLKKKKKKKKKKRMFPRSKWVNCGNCFNCYIWFFPKDFHWIQRIHWIMRKSKNGQTIVTKLVSLGKFNFCYYFWEYTCH